MRAIHAIKLAGAALLVSGSIHANAQGSDAAAVATTPASTTSGARQGCVALRMMRRSVA
jgi:hyperosmotically inducible periplasmic protein